MFNEFSAIISTLVSVAAGIGLREWMLSRARSFERRKITIEKLEQLLFELPKVGDWIEELVSKITESGDPFAIRGSSHPAQRVRIYAEAYGTDELVVAAEDLERVAVATYEKIHEAHGRYRTLRNAPRKQSIEILQISEENRIRETAERNVKSAAVRMIRELRK